MFIKIMIQQKNKTNKEINITQNQEEKKKHLHEVAFTHVNQ